MSKIPQWHTTFAYRLRQARELAQLSQAQLARAAGLSHHTKVSHYELGLERPSLENFRRLAIALADATGCEGMAGWLLGLSKKL